MENETSLVAQTETIAGLLKKNQALILKALPKHFSTDRMLYTVATAIQRNPKLLECHPLTLIGAVMQSAQLGLEVGPTEAHLVPYWNGKKNRYEVQLIIDYRGLIKLSRGPDGATLMEARAVHEKDSFEYCFGLNAKLNHTPTRDPNPGKTIAAYAVARIGTQSQFDVMLADEIEAIRNRSKTKDAGPWKTDYDEMAKKSVVRRLCKLIPSSRELQDAVSLDERAALDIPQDLGTLVDQSEIGTDANPRPQATAPRRKEPEILPAPIPQPTPPPQLQPESVPLKSNQYIVQSFENVNFQPMTDPETKKTISFQMVLPDGMIFYIHNKDMAQLLKTAKDKNFSVILTWDGKETHKVITEIEQISKE